MKRIALIIVLLFLANINPPADGVTNKQLYQTLDSLIEHQQDIIAQKEAHISHIHEGIHGLALTPEQEYTYYMRLYDEYLAFNFDSAYYYIDRNLHLPRHPGDYQHFALSAIRMAHILAVSGLFDHAYSQLSKVCADSLTDPLRVEYYNQWSEIFLYRSEMEQFTPFSGQDTDSAQYYRQLVMQIAPKESFDYVSCIANYTCEKGDVDLAIANFSDSLPGVKLHEFYREEVVMLVSRELFLSLYGEDADRRIQAFEEGDYSVLADCPLIVGGMDDLDGQIARNLLKREGIMHPHIVASSSNAETQLALCIRGVGACFCPVILARGALTEEQIDSLITLHLGESARYRIRFGCQDDTYQWSIIEAFMNTAKELVHS